MLPGGGRRRRDVPAVLRHGGAHRESDRKPKRLANALAVSQAHNQPQRTAVHVPDTSADTGSDPCTNGYASASDGYSRHRSHDSGSS